MEATQTKTVTRMLMCRMTEDEINASAMSAAQLAQKYQEAEVEKKDIVSKLTIGLKDIRGAIARAALLATTGEEERPVECEWHYEPLKGRKKLIRLDTKETVLDEPMSATEMAPVLSLGIE